MDGQRQADGQRKHRGGCAILPRRVSPAVVRDPEIGIIVELVGVLSVARAIASAAIDPGKHLVTANKQLVAECGVELAEHAVRRDHGWPPTNRCWRRKAG